MKTVLVRGQILVKTGLHIGAGNDDIHIGGIDNSVVKDPEGYPYIPGSSLKGKLRTLLELSENSLGNAGKPSNRNDNPDSLIPVMFGDTTTIKNSDDTKSKPVTTRVLFRDSFITAESKKLLCDKNLSSTEVKSENTINRITGKAGDPRNIERIIPGIKFDYEIVVRVFEGDDEEEFKSIIKKGLDLLEHDALGGSGSRGYGQVEFKNSTWNGEKFRD